MGMYLIVPISMDSLLSGRVLNSRCPDWLLLFSNVKVLPRDAGHPRLAPSHVVKTSMNPIKENVLDSPCCRCLHCGSGCQPPVLRAASRVHDQIS